MITKATKEEEEEGWDDKGVVVIIIVRYTLLLAHEGLRCMRHADVDAKYDTLHIDSNGIVDIHVVVNVSFHERYIHEFGQAPKTYAWKV